MADDERRHPTPLSTDALPPTLYLGIDGSGIPVRPDELAGRAGKQPDGKAKTREGKLVIAWSAESRDEEGLPVRDPGSITYSAAIESAATRDTDEYPCRVCRACPARSHPPPFHRSQTDGGGRRWRRL